MGSPSFPNESLVVRNPVPLQEDNEFLLKRNVPVVLLLVGDVRPDRIDVRPADAERPVPRLPREVRPLRPRFMDPLGRVALHDPHRVCDRQRRRQGNEQVDVVGRPVDFQSRPADLPKVAAHVGEQVGPKGGVDLRQPVLRAEDDVGEEVGERVGHRPPRRLPWLTPWTHSAAPAGAGPFWRRGLGRRAASRRLTPWATFCRPCRGQIARLTPPRRRVDQPQSRVRRLQRHGLDVVRAPRRTARRRSAPPV